MDNITAFERNTVKWVSFDIHPDIHNVECIARREATIKAERIVKSSNATKQMRYVIETEFKLAGKAWTIQLTLTDRSDMTYLMLLGREAMMNKIIVDPSEAYLLS